MPRITRSIAWLALASSLGCAFEQSIWHPEGAQVRIVPIDPQPDEAAHGYELRIGPGSPHSIGVVYESGAQRAGGIVAGVATPYELDRADFEMIDLVPGGPRELVASIEWSLRSDEPHTCERTDAEQAALVLCGLVDSVPRCVSIPTRARTLRKRSALCADGESPAIPESHGYSITARFERGEVVLDDASEAPITGRHAALDLLRRDDLLLDSPYPRCPE